MTEALVSPLRSDTDPMRQLSSSLKLIEQQLSNLEKLPRERLRDELAVSRTGSAKALSVLERFRALARRLEQVTQHAREGEVERVEEAARRQGARHVEDLLRTGQLLEPATLAAELGWTRQALSKALAARRLFFLEVKGDRYYPAFFADARYERRQLEAISKLLDDLPGAAKFLFMTTPKASLAGLTPLQALEKGRVAEVKVAAEGFAHR